LLNHGRMWSSLAHVVIYGAEPGGIAAALTCARRSGGQADVVLCFPEQTVGGALGPGALQSWERRPWMHNSRRSDPQGGHFAQWLTANGACFAAQAMIHSWERELSAAGVRLLPAHDLEAVRTKGADGRVIRSRSRRAKSGPPTAIDAIGVRPLVWDHDAPSFGADHLELSADVFIDASSTGRLATLGGVRTSIGRQDWHPDCRQMAAALMIAVEGLDWDAILAAVDGDGRPVWGTAEIDGHRCLWGGQSKSSGDDLVAAFHQGHPHFRLGSIRATEIDPGIFWVQGLNVFGVDARLRHYDQGTERAQAPFPANALDLDAAYHAARQVAQSSDLLGALRGFPGWERVCIAHGTDGAAMTGQTLCLRETVHALGPAGFAVSIDDVTGAGMGANDGKDARHYSRRVGLGFYWLENVGYVGHENVPMPHAATNPAFLPLDAILAPPMSNLLVCGFAASIDSHAWWAMRANPNQCVLGDAAGATAAYALREGRSPLRFGNPEMAAIQSWLQGEGAILEKW